MKTCKGICITDLGAVGDGKTDCTPAFKEAAAAVADAAWGTIHVPDGTFNVSAPVRLDNHVSLRLAPSGMIRAADTFDGQAVVIKGEKKLEQAGAKNHCYGGEIAGGIIDANRHEILGIYVPWGRRYGIRSIEIVNARAGGVHVGEQGWYEATIHGVRAALDFDCKRLDGSVGLRVDCSDCHISQVLLIGYETGLHATGSSAAFNQVHVWAGANRPMKYAFLCEGWNDVYTQCQADAFDNVAFRVNAPFQRFIGNFCQTNDNFSQPEHLIGFEIGERGTHCSYLGNFHNARECVPIEQAFSGSMEGATVLGNLYTGNVTGGFQNRLPSDTGGASWIPPFGVAGPGFVMGDASDGRPRDDEGKPGEVRWGMEDGRAVLYLRTPTGWQAARFE